MRARFLFALWINGVVSLLIFQNCALLKNDTAYKDIRIYAFKYGESDYRSALVNTLSQKPWVKLNWIFYLIVTQTPPQYTLIDTGFADAAFRRQFGLKNFKYATDLLAAVGVKPKEIGRVILTHSHFDHANNVPLFENAHVYMQAAEFNQLSDKSILPFLNSLQAQGKLHLIKERSHHLDPFEVIFTGAHTAGSQVVRLTVNDKTYLFTGDECYFQDACRARTALPKISAYSVKRNIDFLQTISERDIILTGHETQLSQGRRLNDSVYLIESK